MKNSDFRVSPPGSSGDTIISYILGILGGIFIILSVIKSIISRGTVERIYGVLMISAFLMAFTGIVFGVIGYHAELKDSGLVVIDEKNGDQCDRSRRLCDIIDRLHRYRRNRNIQ